MKIVLRATMRNRDAGKGQHFAHVSIDCTQPAIAKTIADKVETYLKSLGAIIS